MIARLMRSTELEAFDDPCVFCDPEIQNVVFVTSWLDTEARFLERLGQKRLPIVKFVQSATWFGTTICITEPFRAAIWPHVPKLAAVAGQLPGATPTSIGLFCPAGLGFLTEEDALAYNDYAAISGIDIEEVSSGIVLVVPDSPFPAPSPKYRHRRTGRDNTALGVTVHSI